MNRDLRTSHDTRGWKDDFDVVYSERTAVNSTQFPSDKRICAQCSDLDLRRALTWAAVRRTPHRLLPHEKYGRPHLRDLDFGYTIVKVGHRFRRPPLTDCPLCSILFASRLVLKSGQGVQAVEDGDEVRVIRFLDWSGFVQDAEEFERHPSAYLAVVPATFGSTAGKRKDYELLQSHVYSQGAAILRRLEDRPVLFDVQEVPDRLNPGVVTDWIQHCKRNHTTLCDASTNSSACGLRLIDCATLSIKPADSNMPYIALSYVWGKPSESDGGVRLENNRLELPANPSVISDAVSVTKALGFRYLWVDKFCINQEDPDTKHEQIGQMNIIYEKADLTIVAAAGLDESYGLPGIGRTLRIPQKAARLDGVHIISTMRHPHASIRSSRWTSRGWTYQEAELSRRRLVFTDEQVYFECRSMYCMESICSRVDLLNRQDLTRSVKTFRAGIFGRLSLDKMSLSEVFFEYKSAVHDFSSRDLSYDSDSLNAFRGIIQRFSTIPEPLCAVWGMPYPVHGGESTQMEYFCAALSWRHAQCWENSKLPRRRSGFPSWTWAGWEGVVDPQLSPRHLPDHNYFESGIESIWLGDGATEEERLGSLDRAIPESKLRVLQLLAKKVSPPLLDYRITEDGEISWFVGSCRAELYTSLEHMSGERFAEEMVETRRWRCIWICSSTFDHFIMILKRNPDAGTWMRAGLFQFQHRRGDLMGLLTGDLEATWFYIE